MGKPKKDKNAKKPITYGRVYCDRCGFGWWGVPGEPCDTGHCRGTAIKVTWPVET